MSRAIALTGMLLTVALSSAASAKEYDIKFHRPQTIGTRYAISLLLTRQDSSFAKVDGDSQKPEELISVVELVGSVEVLAVNDKGYPIAEEYAIQKCVQTVGKKTAELIKPGTPLVVRLTQQGLAIDMDGEPLPEEIRAVVTDLFEMTDGEVGNDDVFGSTKARAPGDVWGLNATGAAAFAKAAGFTTTGMTGKSLLVGVQKVGGADCLEISSSFSVPQVTPPEMAVPPKFTVQKATFKSTNWGLYPADNKSLPVHEKTTTDSELTVTGTKGSAKIVATTVSKQIRETKRGPLPVVAASPSKSKVK